jgi:hypothetical protein
MGLLFLAVSTVENERAKNSNPHQDDRERVQLAVASVDFDFKQSREIVDHRDPATSVVRIRRTTPPMSGLPDIGNQIAQVGYSRLGSLIRAT